MNRLTLATICCVSLVACSAASDDMVASETSGTNDDTTSEASTSSGPDTAEPSTTGDPDRSTTNETTEGSTTEAATETSAGEGSFAEVEAILSARCGSACHQPDGFWPNFDLSGDIYDTIVSKPGPSQGPQCNLIEPGDPSASYLFRKLVGTQSEGCGGSGMQMPVLVDLSGSDPLPQDQLDLIEAWILDGAMP